MQSKTIHNLRYDENLSGFQKMTEFSYNMCTVCPLLDTIVGQISKSLKSVYQARQFIIREFWQKNKAVGWLTWWEILANCRISSPLVFEIQMVMCHLNTWHPYCIAFLVILCVCTCVNVYVCVHAESQSCAYELDEIDLTTRQQVLVRLHTVIGSSPTFM